MSVQQQLQASWHDLVKRLTSDKQQIVDHKPDFLNLSKEEQIRYYRNWLTTRYQNDTKEQNLKEANAYAQEALQPVQVGKQTLTPFAPFRKEVSAYRVITFPQQVVMGILFALFIVALLINFTVALTVVVGAIIIFYFLSIFLNFALTLKSVTDPGHIEIDEDIVHALADAPWPRYTILCPLYKEEESAPQLIRAMSELDYPADRLQVMIMLEEDDKGTQAVLNQLDLPDFVELIILPDGKPRTKPRSCNYGFTQATGDYAVIYDAEDIPDPLQLKKAVLAFAQGDENLACVQAKLNYYNVNQNALTRWFTIEYSTWYEMIMPGLQWAKLSIPLGGTSNHFSSKILRKLGAWDAFNVTEDCDLGMRLEHDGYYTVVLDSTTYEEANSQLPNWITQRTRWIKGFLITYMVYMRNPARYLHPSRWMEFFSLQFVIGGRTLVVLLNPIMMLLLLVYFIFGAQVQDLYDQIFPGPIFYMGFFSLVFGNILYIYTHMFGAVRIKRYDLVRWAALMPYYWLYHSIAGYKALYNSILRPHFWEKTKHGLNKESEENDVPDITEYVTDDKGNTRRLYDEIELAKLERYKPVENDNTHVTRDNRFLSWLFRDTYLTATLFVAMIASFVSIAYFVGQGLTMLSNEAGVNLYVARRIFDSATPGLGQLSYEQLPLYHLLVGPLTLNTDLFVSGLAGTIVSAISFVIAVVYVYLTAKALTGNRQASFVGTLVFALNPNILFLQSVPMVTMLAITTLVATSYYFIRWIQNDNPRTLVAIALAVFLATLTSYPAWLLFLVLLVAILYIGKKRGYSANQLEGNFILYTLFGGLAILLWIAWNAVILGNPLPGFGATPTPAEADLIAGQTGMTIGNMLSTMVYAVVEIVGVIPLGLAIIGSIFFINNQRKSMITIGMFSLIVPTIAIGLALLTGYLVISVPQVADILTLPIALNTDAVTVIIAPIAVLVALGINGIQQLIDARDMQTLMRPIVATSGAIIIVLSAGILVRSDNLLTVTETQTLFAGSEENAIIQHLSDHYRDGIIWMSRPDEIAYPLATRANITYSNLIHEGNVDDWGALEANPAMAEWIIISTADEDDTLAKLVAQYGEDYFKDFQLVLETETGDQLFQRS